MKGMAAAFGSRRRYEGAQRLARLGRGPLAKAAVPGWTAMRDLPEPPKETFRDWWQRERGQGRHPRAHPRRARARRRPCPTSRAPIAPPARCPARASSTCSASASPSTARPSTASRRPTSPRRSAQILAGAERVGVPARARRPRAPSSTTGSRVAELDTLDAVVTGSALAIADTGTIVLDSGPRVRPPRAHARARPPRLHRRRRDSRRRPCPTPSPRSPRRPPTGRPITFVSGPSATSDIELDRVEGVHGPRMLDVIVSD